MTSRLSIDVRGLGAVYYRKRDQGLYGLLGIKEGH
jgi:hypothetical protein